MTRSATLRLAFLISVAVSSAARADRIHLRGGGEIQGVILKDADRPDEVIVQTERSSHPLIFEPAQVLEVVREAGPLDEYLAHRDEVEPIAQAQYDFALWCEENKLVGPAEIHFLKAVEIDPGFGLAQKKLGRVLHGGRWMTYDQRKVAQGLIKFKGKWISQAEKDKRDARAKLSSEQASWASRIKILRAKLLGDEPAQQSQAEAQLAAVRDPAAVPGLVYAFSGDSAAVRIRLGELLGAIPGAEATKALVALIVGEDDADVRQAMLEELGRRRDPDAPGLFVDHLKLNDPNSVGRAAWALATSQTASAVPRLVEALTQNEFRVVMTPVANPGGGGLGGSYTFAQGLNGGTSLGPNVPPGLAVYRSYPVLTGVAVAPGAVAFGGGSIPLPYGNNPVGGFNNTSTRAVPQRITIVHPNLEVRRALISLTGQDFGYNKASWRKWIASEFHPETAPARRVPQP